MLCTAQPWKSPATKTTQPLIRPSQALSMRGGKLAVANLNPQIDEFFRLTGLDQMFRVFGTVDEAIDGIAS
jgi:anti-anti-sigma regulatory factor